MILDYSYWNFKGVIKPEVCDRIINIGKDNIPQLGMTYKYNHKKDGEYTEEDKQHVLKTRNSNVSWINDPWVFNIIRPLINRANEQAGWNFDWDYTESAQFTVYNQGQFYDWHPDQSSKPYTDKDEREGKYRKLSCTLLLNDPQEFEGGDLEFQVEQKKTMVCTEIDCKGSLVVFPSFVLHRVLPVTRGTRYSLVMWHLGYPFK